MCGCTPGGLVVTKGFGSACAPRSEDSGMAGPERPFRAVTAGGEGGAHAARRQRQYEGTEVRTLMVRTGQTGLVSMRRKRSHRKMEEPGQSHD